MLASSSIAVPIQSPCQRLGPPVAHALLMDKIKLLSSFLLLLCFCDLGQGQLRNHPLPQQRAIEIESAIREASARYGLDPRILRAICFAESRYRVNAISPKGALGPMQFMPETAARYGLKNPFDPRAAIDAGARYLRDLLLRFNGRIDLALAAYNAGEGAVESFLSGKPLVLRTGKIINPRGLVTGGVPPYAETQSYVRGIIWSLANNRSSNRALTLAQSDKFGVAATTQKPSAKKTSFIEVE